MTKRRHGTILSITIATQIVVECVELKAESHFHPEFRTSRLGFIQTYNNCEIEKLLSSNDDRIRLFVGYEDWRLQTIGWVGSRVRIGRKSQHVTNLIRTYSVFSQLRVVFRTKNGCHAPRGQDYWVQFCSPRAGY